MDLIKPKFIEIECKEVESEIILNESSFGETIKIYSFDFSNKKKVIFHVKEIFRMEEFKNNDKEYYFIYANKTYSVDKECYNSFRNFILEKKPTLKI